MSDQVMGFLVAAVIWLVIWGIGRAWHRRREERYWMESADRWNVRFPYLPIETSDSMRRRITGVDRSPRQE